MITGKEAVRLAAERQRKYYPEFTIYSRGWLEDDEYYCPSVFVKYPSKGPPGFLVNKQTGEVEEFHYLPNLPIAARLKAMKRTKFLFRRVIIRPRRFRRMWNTLFRKD
ncbi:hypothetical protein [Actinotignum schaalii]|uniref:hypothetical protein n=1 Tax=Actinotignum schaalii TaxID=59505 RepID=UPI0012DF148C|nr:hypothetical protein [Actinotignum schaalii]